VNREITIDNFAGGGGASTAIELATGRPVDAAVNHDPAAITMHEANHPETAHYCESVWDVKPREVTKGRPVGIAWFSPDCTHFSIARGGKPADKKIRGLAWIALRWAATVKPRVIYLENVKEFLTWGPLLPNGKPDPNKKGQTFRSFIRQLRNLGYEVEWRVLKACDYGAPTSRERLFLIARCDGRPIIWPKQTHADRRTPAVAAGKLMPYRSAAEIIDWTIPCRSIFNRKKPLAENTLRRIARGLRKFVIEAENPFIVPGGAAFISRIGQTNFGGDRLSYSLEDALTTITTKTEHLLVTAFLQQYYTSDSARGQGLEQPIMTIPTENRYGLVTAHICKFRGTNFGQPIEQPIQTISAGGMHHSLVQAFLIEYYGASTGQDVQDPIHTIVGKDRFGLVYVHGNPYQIVDIGMRMLTPRELYRGQGFPESYIIDPIFNGKPFTQSEQVHKCGNSVSPIMGAALIRANQPEMCVGSGNALTLSKYHALEQQGQLAMNL